MESPNFVVITADIPVITTVNLLNGSRDMLFIGKKYIRQLVVDAAAFFTAKTADHQGCLIPVLSDKSAPACSDQCE